MLSPSRIITVDVGNSSTKLGCYTTILDSPPLALHAVDGTEWNSIPRHWFADQSCFWAIASVNRHKSSSLDRWIQLHRTADSIHHFMFNDVPIALDVQEPCRVGMDRIVAAYEVNRLREPTRPAIVIDSGTAITIDLIDAHGCFLGGNIVPGFDLCLASLSKGTDAIPLFEKIFSPRSFGRNTEEAVQLGIFQAISGGINLIVRRIQSEMGSSCVVFSTGGNITDFQILFDFSAVHIPTLVLDGLAHLASLRLKHP